MTIVCSRNVRAVKAVDVAYVAVPALFVWEDLSLEQMGSTLHQESDSEVGLR